MGTLWHQSGTIARDNSDIRAVAALGYFYSGGTTTPITVYSDAAEASPLTQPVTSDGNGRWPTVFVPYMTSFDYKVTTSGGTQLSYPTSIPNANPVTASSSVTTSSTQVYQTGMTMFTFTDAAQSGFARLNGRTLGNGASSATERANADTSDLFAHLWNNLADTLAAVSTGRGGTAAADYAANKTITLPDMRGAVPVGLDTMGAAAGSFLTAVTFTAGNSSTVGSPGGENTHALSTAELASHSHGAGTFSGATHSHTGTTDSNGAHTHTYNAPTSGASTVVNGAGQVSGLSSNTTSSDGAHTHTFTTGNSGALTVSGTSATAGSGTAHNIVQKCKLVTWHCKL